MSAACDPVRLRQQNTAGDHCHRTAERSRIHGRRYADADAPAAFPGAEVLALTGLSEGILAVQKGVIQGYADSENVIDIELIYRLAYYLNAELEIRTYDFYGIVTAMETGLCDCAFSNLNATPEREEAMGFSDPVYTTRTRVLVRASGTASAEKFSSKLN